MIEENTEIKDRALVRVKDDCDFLAETVKGLESLNGRIFKVHGIREKNDVVSFHLEGSLADHFFEADCLDLVMDPEGLSVPGDIGRGTLIMALPRNYHLKTLNIGGRDYTVAVTEKRMNYDFTPLLGGDEERVWTELQNAGCQVFRAGEWVTPGKAGLW